MDLKGGGGKEAVRPSTTLRAETRAATRGGGAMNTFWWMVNMHKVNDAVRLATADSLVLSTIVGATAPPRPAPYLYGMVPIPTQPWWDPWLRLSYVLHCSEETELPRATLSCRPNNSSR